jgi:uncharacterized protein
VSAGPTLIVIAKQPVPGRVKTRLTPPCTPSEAALLAEAALADTLTAVAASPAGRRVLVLDGRPGDWLPPGFDVVPQRGGGLADRLAGAFAAVDGPALLVGMDTPQVGPTLIGAGCEALERADSVVGPAVDGGYWAIGLRRPDARVFAGVPMSEPTTGAAQLARLVELGYGVDRLPRLRDVDTIADARAVAGSAPATRFAAALRELEARVAA